MKNKLPAIPFKSISVALFLFATGKPGFSQTIVNPSFESWGSSNICYVNTPPNNWLDYSDGGLGADEADFNYCPTTIPPNAANGVVYARCYAATDSTGEGMYQMVHGFEIGKTYLLSYDYAGSNLYGGTGDIQWHTFIDDTDVNQTPVFHSTDAFWTTNSFSFIAYDSVVKIGFRCYTTTMAAGSGGIDNLGLNNTTTGGGIIKSDLTVSIFPNPAKNLLTISLSENSPATYQISNVYGLSICSGMIQGNNQEKQIDISGINAGIYFLKITLRDGSVTVKKIEIER